MAFWNRKKRSERAAPPGDEQAARPLDEWEFKRAWERQRVGLVGLLPYPSAGRATLFRWSRESDVAYSCIRVIVESAHDPDLIVQRRKNRQAEWETEYGHPLRQLLMRPNPEMTQAEFFGCWLASEQICGLFIAEIERNGRGKPVALHPLDPTQMERLEDGRWQWRNAGEEVIFQPHELFVSFLSDPQSPWQPLAPLQVALGAIEADWMQNSFVRAFFKNGGVPSGIIKVKGVLAGAEGKKRAEDIKQNWMRNRGIMGRFFGAPEVFDDNATYEKVGSNLAELEGGTLRGQNETRICGVFGVPPLLVSAYVGLEFVNQRASAIESQKDFWANKMSPVFKRLRTKLQWSLLEEWETEAAIRAETVRVFWDMGNVIALQETIGERDARARESFRAGAIMLSQYKAIVGLPVESGDEYYLRRVNQIPITRDVIAAQAEAAATIAARAVSLVVTGDGSPTVEEAGIDGKARRRKSCGCGERKGTVGAGIPAVLEAAAVATAAVLRAAAPSLIAEAENYLQGMAAGQWARLNLMLPYDVVQKIWGAAEEAFDAGIETVLAAQRGRGKPAFAVRDVDRGELGPLLETYLAQWLNQVQAEAVRLWAQPFYQARREAWREQLAVQIEGATKRYGGGLGRRACSLGRGKALFTYGSKSRKDVEEEESPCWAYEMDEPGKKFSLVGWKFIYMLGNDRSCPQCSEHDGEEQIVMDPRPAESDVLLPEPGSICYQGEFCNCYILSEAICVPRRAEEE